jgi:hypothetical protein
MKIIAITEVARYDREPEKFLVELSACELSQLIGRNHYDRNKDGPLKVGDQIQVSAMYDKLQRMKEHERLLTKYAQELQDFAADLTIRNPLIRSDIAGDTFPEKGIP